MLSKYSRLKVQNTSQGLWDPRAGKSPRTFFTVCGNVPSSPRSRAHGHARHPALATCSSVRSHRTAGHWGSRCPGAGWADWCWRKLLSDVALAAVVQQGEPTTCGCDYLVLSRIWLSVTSWTAGTRLPCPSQPHKCTWLGLPWWLRR